jgi:hypothetical protein
MQRLSVSILRCAGLALLTSALLLAGCGGLERGGVTADRTPNQGVYPPSATPFGRTYGEWSVAWCQWFLSIPKSQNPVMDETGEKVAVGQSETSPVWFLAGTIGTEAERTCTVPADKALLIPIINGFFWIPTDGPTPEALRAVAKEILDHVTEVEMTVDGVSLQGLQNFRFQSPDFFNFTGPAEEEETIFPAQTGTHLTYADGYYVMLEPLAPGEHTIWFRAKMVFPATFPQIQVFELNITYHLTMG